MKRTLFLTLILSVCSLGLRAQYPQVTSEANARWAAKAQYEDSMSNVAWQKALPIIEEEARHGRPFVKWAHRPDDLPQADIPAFPGAEGGGMFTFGGRGGKHGDIFWDNESYAIKHYKLPPPLRLERAEW